MNSGREFSIPQANEVSQNGNVWSPSTPAKPNPHRSDDSQKEKEMLQIPIGEENWEDLLGIYTDVLQGGVCDNLPQDLNLNSLPNPCPKVHSTQDVVPVETTNILQQNFSSLLVQNGSNQVFDPIGVQDFTSYNHQNLRSASSSDSLASGEVTVTHQKVNSLADLMGTPPNRNIIVGVGSNNREAYASPSIVGAKLHRTHVLYSGGDVGGCNLQKSTNGTHSNRNYNLNLPPRPEARETSRSIGQFPFVPATPVLKNQSKTYQISQMSNSSSDKTSTQEKHAQNNVISSSPLPEIRRTEHSEILLSTPNESVTASESGKIDLNQTPQQKPPRRKKHRPKVIREGKPKQTPKPATDAKGQTPDDKSKVKRKYVRKSTVNASETPLVNEVNPIGTPNGGPRPTKKSKVRNRKLDFDSENGAKGESQDNQAPKVPFNLNLDAQISDGSTSSTGPLTSTRNENSYAHSNSNIVPQDSLALVNMAPPRNHPLMSTRNENNYVHSNSNIVPQDSLALVTMAPPRNHQLNAISRVINIQNSSANQSTQVHHRINGGLNPRAIHSSSRLPNSYGITRQSAVQNKPPQLVGVTEIQGSEMRYPRAINLMGSQLWSNEVSDTRRYNREISGLDMGGKANIDYKFHGASSSFTPSGVTTHDEFSRQIGRSKDLQSGEWVNTDIRGHIIHRNPNEKSNKLTHGLGMNMNYPGLKPEFHNQHASSQVRLCSEQVAPPKTSRSFSAVTNWNMGSASQRDTKSIPINGIINPTYHDVKRRVDGQTLSKGPVIDKHLELQVKSRRNYRNSTKKVAGLQEEGMISVDYIINLLKNFHIWNDNGKSALVPYNGDAAVAPYKGDASVVEYKGGFSVVGYKGDGAVVPFNPVKKQKPRPRVDLDPETNRLWNLLMGKEGSESAETMDANKQKWWEEERKVFRGRVDSFIARMHLIQGDRRFSKWKGSVVDSVIGVYLTQNVSDHLSSSAFMSLAARFPLKLSTTCQPSNKSPSVEHHEVRITYPDGTTYEQKIPRDSIVTSAESLEYKTNNVMTEGEPANNHSTMTSTESLEYKANDVMTEKGIVLGNDHTNKTEEDIISSHSSSESFVFQACEDIRSSSGSNSEGDDVWNLNKNLGYLGEQTEGIVGSSHSYQGLLFGLQQSENQGLAAPASSTVYSESSVAKVLCNQNSVLPSTNFCVDSSLGLEKWEEDYLGISANESISTLASTEVEVTNGTGIIATNEYIGQNSESAFSGIENRIPEFQPSQVNHEILNKHPELKTDKSVKRIGQENFQQESVFITDSTRSAEASSKQPSGTTHVPAKAAQVNSSGKQASNIGSTSPNPRKRKAEKEKVEQFDWDILRKQAQSKCGTREKCREHMDSLDYETLRNADVREISDAIKERGMNNMLAERMKSFLNRLVQDHEKIDLEWLRDVDPDKVKDYLLSIRGLGLKSVECVRLLTLHHLAFPVDTNVGRIAVRLGWVPLQPLPESLQLHLLELYPVLETIQKYIWPRLCNLDQETLYELHYQMITFGKVFCTKRDPNCNGCPMRGECRHFASAFASARLALPGPEEKRIVTSAAAPVTPNKGPDVIIKPMLLNSSEGNINREIMEPTGNSNCEPLIEEPLSPEPLIEVTERDIEDAFYEDPDEIPVIKLNTQEFATNLQSFMQEQMELGEADMSKALVALSPEFASMSIPKLKHVSRLRTEHQVYELPDSHPLLKEMDRREPDDPSPYLLAIWTPGETADSFQPPESRCGAQEGDGGLCNNKTCFSCNSSREAQAQTVRGTILVPCRTATRGSFPLNGTYFQVNEVFADHESSLKPIDVPRRLLWKLRKRTVFFGSSVTSIFKGLTTEGIQYCFWKGFVCVRGFDQKSRAPKPLMARLHISASKVGKQSE